ncbi:hypothetical protein J3R82DRAFT_9850 [Butyriboletus roseoflavus]|nr:hypothetical protein J3R82DRAFT_9850 [Butyriboletus roseoflavus]
MSSRFADPTTMRTWSPIYHDDSSKRPPPSPSNKAPPSKKLDAKSRAVSEEPSPPSKASQPAVVPSSESYTESCTDKVCRSVSHIHATTLPAHPPPSAHSKQCSPPLLFPKVRQAIGSSSTMEVFEQILELDEGDSQEFSQDMVKEYLGQTQATIKLMDECLCASLSLQSITDVSLPPSAKHELTQLGKHGHFLKGSSAALGVVQVQEICEKIQHLGNRIDPDKEPEVKISVEDAFARIKPLLARLKEEHAVAAKWLKKFFEGSQP